MFRSITSDLEKILIYSMMNNQSKKISFISWPYDPLYLNSLYKLQRKTYVFNDIYTIKID